jgi:hypothetical protein
MREKAPRMNKLLRWIAIAPAAPALANAATRHHHYYHGSAGTSAAGNFQDQFRNSY